MQYNAYVEALNYELQYQESLAIATRMDEIDLIWIIEKTKGVQNASVIW